MQEVQPGEGIQGTLGASDLLKGKGMTTPFPCHHGAQCWFLRSPIWLCSLHFQAGTLSDLHLTCIKEKSILAWLLMQKIMKSQIAVTVRLKTIDRENWKSLSQSLLFCFFFFFLSILSYYYGAAIFIFQTSIHWLLLGCLLLRSCLAAAQLSLRRVCDCRAVL